MRAKEILQKQCTGQYRVLINMEGTLNGFALPDLRVYSEANNLHSTIQSVIGLNFKRCLDYYSIIRDDSECIEAFNIYVQVIENAFGQSCGSGGLFLFKVRIDKPIRNYPSAGVVARRLVISEREATIKRENQERIARNKRYEMDEINKRKAEEQKFLDTI